MNVDPIDELLKADEEELKAKRARLRAFARSVEAAREGIRQAQTTGEAIASSDGLSRADIARTFGLSSAEKALLLPSRRGKSAGRAETLPAVEQAHDGDAAPDNALDGQQDGQDHQAN